MKSILTRGYTEDDLWIASRRDAGLQGIAPEYRLNTHRQASGAYSVTPGTPDGKGLVSGSLNKTLKFFKRIQRRKKGWPWKR